MQMENEYCSHTLAAISASICHCPAALVPAVQPYYQPHPLQNLKVTSAWKIWNWSMGLICGISEPVPPVPSRLLMRLAYP